MESKNLILSWDSYSWIAYCADMISKTPDKFEIIIITRDDETPIHNCNPNLCYDAVYVQRHYDILNTSKKLKLNKVMNLGYLDDYDIPKLAAQLQLYIIVNRIKKIYYSYNTVLHKILCTIQKSYSFEMLAYGKCDGDLVEEIILKHKDYTEKCNLMYTLNGIPYNPPISTEIEKYYKIN